MQEVIDSSVKELVKIINSKPNSLAVAWQFILEELDAAKDGMPFVQDRIDTFYISSEEYFGAINRSWDDVDGWSGPQQFLVNITIAITNTTNIDTAAMVRITIVEYIIQYYGFGRYYLDKSLRSAKKPLDLFSLVAKKDKLHPHFKHLLEKENEEIKNVVLRWSNGFEDRDNKFNYEFQTTFNSSFWEIYLNQCFHDLDMSIDFSKSSPDFSVVSKNKNIINIEAVTANHAINSDPEWSRPESQKEKGEFLNFSCVRILNAINSKYKKYKESYSKLDHVIGNPYIIALAPFDQPYFFIQNNEAIIRVLYGQGIDDNSKEVFVPAAKKNPKVSLMLGIFTNDMHKEISAIIFSTTATIGKAISQSSLNCKIRSSRYHHRKGLVCELTDNSNFYETHLDGLQIHHNPYAENPINASDFDKYEVTHYYYDVENREIDNQQKNYTLISRNAIWTIANASLQ